MPTLYLLLSKLKEISAETDFKFPYRRTAARVSSKFQIAVPESRQSESHYEKSKNRCLEVQLLNQSAEVP